MSRVLTILFGTVLLANAGLGLYLLLRTEAEVALDPPLTAPELGRELSLLRPREGSPAGSGRTPVGAEDDRPDERGAGTVRPGATAPPRSADPATAAGCFYWGPFSSETEARKRLSELVSAGGLTEDSGARVAGTTVQRDPDFMIFVGPYANGAAARKVRDELKALGSDAHVVTRDDRLVVSTGVFSRRRFAASQTAKLREWGYAPQQTELIRTQRIYFLLADVPTKRSADIDPDISGSAGADSAATRDNRNAEGSLPFQAAGRCGEIASQYGIL